MTHCLHGIASPVISYSMAEEENRRLKQRLNAFFSTDAGKALLPSIRPHCQEEQYQELLNKMLGLGVSRDRVDKLRAGLEELRQQECDMKQELDAAYNSITVLGKSTSVLPQVIAELEGTRAKLYEHRIANFNLTRKLARLTESVNTGNELNLEELKFENSELVQKVQSLKTRIAHFGKDFDSVSAKIARLGSRVVDNNDSLEPTQEMSLDGMTLEETRRKLHSVNSQLKKARKESVRRAEGSRIDNVILREYNDNNLVTLEKLRGEVAELQARLDSTNRSHEHVPTVLY